MTSFAGTLKVGGRTIDASTFLGIAGTPVTARETTKFVLPVGPFAGGGERLVYPNGEQAGQPILDRRGSPIGETGIVFRDYKDDCWQGAPDDGSAVIIINGVTRDQAVRLHASYSSLLRPGALTLVALKDLLDEAHQIGLGDRYQSKLSFVLDKMAPVPPGDLVIAGSLGFLRKKDTLVYEALYLGGELAFQSSAASEQVFPSGAVFVRQPEGYFRAIQPAEFAQSYQLATGEPIQTVSEQVSNLAP